MKSKEYVAVIEREDDQGLYYQPCILAAKKYPARVDLTIIVMIQRDFDTMEEAFEEGRYYIKQA